LIVPASASTATLISGQREARVLLHDDNVGAEHDLKATAAGDAIDSGDNGFVEVAG